MASAGGATESGLRFSCQPGCTACCRQTGWVYVSAADVERAARFLAISIEAFEQRYVVKFAHRMRLRKPPGSQCHFLEESGCRIHPAKPTQCRLFPFWPELVEDREAWDRTGQQYCPGIGQGPLIQIGTALETAHQMRTAYPELYVSDGENPPPKS
jgi:uncharacterized protein